MKYFLLFLMAWGLAIVLFPAFVKVILFLLTCLLMLAFVSLLWFPLVILWEAFVKWRKEQ